MPPPRLSTFAVRRALTLLAISALSACEPAPTPRVVAETDPIPPPRAAVGRAPISPDLCVVPVLDGEPTAADLGQSSRMISHVEMLPGHPLPFINPWNRGGSWTIDAEPRFVRFPGPAPVGLFELNIVSEANGRIVGGSRDDDAVMVLDPGAGAFRVVHRFQNEHGQYGSTSVARLPRSDTTLVFSGSRVHRLQGDRIEPWAGQAALDRLGVTHPVAPRDLPAFSAVVFHEEGGALAVRFDDGRWRRVHTLKGRFGREYVVSVDEAPASGAALVTTVDEHLALRFRPGPTGPDVDVRSLGKTDSSENKDGLRVHRSGPTGTIVRYEPATDTRPSRWTRLGPDGLLPIPGGDGVELPRLGDLVLNHMADVPTRGGSVLAAKDGLFFYDGLTMRLIPGSGAETIGTIYGVVDLPLLRRTLINSLHGVFELTAELAIVRLDLPFVTGGFPRPEFVEKASSNVVLVLAGDGVFAIDGDGRVERVRGDAVLGDRPSGSFHGEIPARGSVILNAGNRLHLVDDRRLGGCKPPQRPTSDPAAARTR